MEKVTIVMSIYKPNCREFELQLRSLEAQTYENLELLIWNDCPGTQTDRELVSRCIGRFPVSYYECERNLGYVKAFERLSSMADGDYISFCDQDDIWEPDKIALCMEALHTSGSVAVVCDRALMDADDKVFVRSCRAAGKSPCNTWSTGDDITARAAFFSYCTGMTLIARRDLVQSFLPLVPGLPHDRQLIFLLSAAGRVAYVEKPLVRHRRTGLNASGTLTGVSCKQDYYDTRCKPVSLLLERFETFYPNYPGLREMKACCAARIKGDIIGIWKHRRLIPELYFYEIGLALCPEFIFRSVLKFGLLTKHTGTVPTALR